MESYTSTDSEKELLIPTAPSYLRMLVLGLILLSPTFLYGLNLSYPTVALSQMKLDLSDASWFSSTAIFVSPISSLIVGVVIDAFGRKSALLYSILPSILGWTLQFVSSHMAALLIGQALNGLTIGAVSYPIQVYAGECVMMSSVRLRNTFMVWVAVGSSLGTTVMLLLANFVTYRQICGVCMTFSLLLLAVFVVVLPESPTWLYHRGRLGDAEWSQRKLGIVQPVLRRSDDDAVAPVQPIGSFEWSTMVANAKKITRRDVYLPSILISITALLYQWSGGSSVVTYMINIIDDDIPGARAAATQSNVTDSTAFWYDSRTSDSTKYSLICGVAMCVGSLISSWALPLLGIRYGFVFSNIGNVVGLVALTCSSTVVRSYGTALVVRVAAVTLMAFLVSVSLGPSMVASGDVFPVDAKGFACIPDIVAYFAAGLSNKTFPYLYFSLGGYTYLVYAAVSLASSVYIFLFTPEVVGKTLEQIHSEFLPPKNDASAR